MKRESDLAGNVLECNCCEVRVPNLYMTVSLVPRAVSGTY